jgi:TPR repeat protein
MDPTTSPLKQPNFLRTIPTSLVEIPGNIKEQVKTAQCNLDWAVEQYSLGNIRQGQNLLQKAYEYAYRQELIPYILPKTKEACFDVFSSIYIPPKSLASSPEVKGFKDAIHAFYFKKNPDPFLTRYNNARDYGYIYLLGPQTMENINDIYSRLPQLYDEKGDFDKALEFASLANVSDVEKGIIYRHKAQRALKRRELELERECYEKAFKLFHTAVIKDKFDEKARKYYEHALWNGLGCDHNISVIRDYFINQLKDKGYLSHGLLDKEKYQQLISQRNQAIKKLETLAKWDVTTQCILGKMYSTGENGLPISPEKSIELYERVLINFATTLSTNLRTNDFLNFPIALKLLPINSNSSEDIKQKALILHKYFEVLSVLKNINPDKKTLATICSQSHATPLQSAIIHLICSDRNEKTIDYLKNITFNDPDFIQFCEYEAKILMQIFEYLPLKLRSFSEEKELLNVLIGGYEYRNKNIMTALFHFSQYSGYKNDLYLQAINLEINSFIKLDEIQALFPLLETTLKKENKSARDIEAIKIITQFYGYDLHKPEQTLQFCQEKLRYFAVSRINQQSSDYLQLLLGLNRLCSENNLISSDIQKKALILRKYFNIFVALRDENKKYLTDLYFELQTPLQSAIIRLVCSDIDSSTIHYIKSLRFEDEEFIQFCKYEAKVIMPIFKYIFWDLPAESEIKELLCILIGGYEYYHKNFAAASYYLSQYNEKDLYLQAIILQANSDNQTKRYQISLPHLTTILRKENKTARDAQAIKIISQFCKYDPSESEEILQFCQERLPLFVASKINPQSIDYLYPFLALNDLCKKEGSISPDIQQKASILQIYYHFFEALQSKDQKKLDALLAAPATKTNSFRSTFLKTIAGCKKDRIKSIIFEDKYFLDFYESDGFIIESLLESLLEHMLAEPMCIAQIKTDQCHYILAGCALRKEDLIKARHHFLQCKKYENDLYLQQKLLATSPINEFVETLALLSKKTVDIFPQRDAKAKELIADICNRIYPDIRTLLLDKKDYEGVYKLIDCLATLQIPQTYQTLCNTFVAAEEKLISESQEDYLRLVISSYRKKINDLLYKMANQKDHPSCFCNAIAFTLNEHLKCDHVAQDQPIAWGIDCFKYLSCSLEHPIVSHADPELKKQHEIKQKKYAQLAYDLAQYYLANNNRKKAIEHFDLAIAQDHDKARYAKALLFPIDETTLPIIIEHAVSDDSDRVLSLARLGKYYSELSGSENEKLAFEFLDQAAALGNYDLALKLGYYYADGIKNKAGKLLYAANMEKAIDCFTKVIERKNDQYSAALYLRAMTYYEINEYEKALEDANLLSGQEMSDDQKAIIMWLSGIIAMHIDLAFGTKLLNSAYNYASVDSQVFDDFKLSNHLKTITKTREIISSIISEGKTDIVSLNFCTVMGKLLFIQNIMEPITNEKRMFAVKSLEHAAKKGHLDAQIALAKTDMREVSLCNKINYLEISLMNNPLLSEFIQETLDDLYPNDVFFQAQLIVDFIENNVNEDIIKNYISQLYIRNQPRIIDPINYRAIPYNLTQPLLEKFQKIEFIKQGVARFMENPQLSSCFEHFCTLLSGSLLTYSCNKEKLQEGLAYLDQAHQRFPHFQSQYIKENIGHFYYKLAKCPERYN